MLFYGGLKARSELVDPSCAIDATRSDQCINYDITIYHTSTDNLGFSENASKFGPKQLDFLGNTLNVVGVTLYLEG